MSQRAVEEKYSAVFCVTMTKKRAAYHLTALQDEGISLWYDDTTLSDFIQEY